MPIHVGRNEIVNIIYAIIIIVILINIDFYYFASLAEHLKISFSNKFAYVK